MLFVYRLKVEEIVEDIFIVMLQFIVYFSMVAACKINFVECRCDHESMFILNEHRVT